jgi:hypothetical protein
VPKKKPGDAKKRVAFAEEYEATADKVKFIFSDEKMFDCNDHGATREWCEENEEPTVREKERFSPRVHVWGAIGVNFRLLVVLRQNVNAELYVRRCLSALNHEIVHGDLKGVKFTFMQDNARPHTAHRSIAYLERKEIDFIADWPSRSPDLNPIENLWALLQQEVSRKGPSDEKELEDFVLDCWESFSQTKVNKLVKSFKGRLVKCIGKKGAYVQ